MLKPCSAQDVGFLIAKPLGQSVTPSRADELLLCIVPLRVCIADVSRLARLASLGSLGGPPQVQEVLSWISVGRRASRAKRGERGG